MRGRFSAIDAMVFRILAVNLTFGDFMSRSCLRYTCSEFRIAPNAFVAQIASSVMISSEKNFETGRVSYAATAWPVAVWGSCIESRDFVALNNGFARCYEALSLPEACLNLYIVYIHPAWIYSNDVSSVLLYRLAVSYCIGYQYRIVRSGTRWDRVGPWSWTWKIPFFNDWASSWLVSSRYEAGWTNPEMESNL